MPQGSGRLKCSHLWSFEIQLCLEVRAARAGDLHGRARRGGRSNRNGILLKLKRSRGWFDASPLTEVPSLQAGAFGGKCRGSGCEQGGGSQPATFGVCCSVAVWDISFWDNEKVAGKNPFQVGFDIINPNSVQVPVGEGCSQLLCHPKWRRLHN